MRQSDDYWISTKKLAERWGVHVNTLATWRKNDYGPKAVKRGLRNMFYYLPDVVEFEKENPSLANSKIME